MGATSLLLLFECGTAAVVAVSAVRSTAHFNRFHELDASVDSLETVFDPLAVGEVGYTA